MMSEGKIPPHTPSFHSVISIRQTKVFDDFDNYDYHKALHKIYTLTLAFEPQIKRKMRHYLMEAQKYLDNPKLPCASFVYRFWDELHTCLHNAGYFLYAKGKPSRVKDLGAIREEIKL